MGRTGRYLPKLVPDLFRRTTLLQPLPDPPSQLSIEDALCLDRCLRSPVMEQMPPTTACLQQDIVVSFATANALTLHSPTIDEALRDASPSLNMQLTSARRLDLAIQFENAKLHAIGLQETRWRCPRGWDALGYAKFALPSTPRGQANIKMGIDKKCLQDRNLVFVLRSDHRRLLRKAYTAFCVVIVSLHMRLTTAHIMNYKFASGVIAR